MNDRNFFSQNPLRQARIRKPGKQPFKDKQRAVRMLDEFEREYRSLGQHDPKQRRVIVYRLPSDNPNWDPEHPQLIPIPILEAFEGEFKDTDECLLPVVHHLMAESAG